MKAIVSSQTLITMSSHSRVSSTIMESIKIPIRIISISGTGKNTEYTVQMRDDPPNKLSKMNSLEMMDFKFLIKEFEAMNDFQNKTDSGNIKKKRGRPKKDLSSSETVASKPPGRNKIKKTKILNQSGSDKTLSLNFEGEEDPDMINRDKEKKSGCRNNLSAVRKDETIAISEESVDILTQIDKHSNRKEKKDELIEELAEPQDIGMILEELEDIVEVSQSENKESSIELIKDFQNVLPSKSSKEELEVNQTVNSKETNSDNKGSNSKNKESNSDNKESDVKETKKSSKSNLGSKSVEENVSSSLTAQQNNEKSNSNSLVISHHADLLIKVAQRLQKISSHVEIDGKLYARVISTLPGKEEKPMLIPFDLIEEFSPEIIVDFYVQYITF